MKGDRHQRNGPRPNVTAHKRLHERTSEGKIWARFRWYAERHNKRVKQWWTRDSCCLTTQRQGEVPHLWSRTRGAWVPHPVIFNCWSDRLQLVRESRLRFACLGSLTIELRSSPAKSGPVHLASAKTFPLYFANLKEFGTEVTKMFFSWQMIYFCFATGAISLRPIGLLHREIWRPKLPVFWGPHHIKTRRNDNSSFASVHYFCWKMSKISKLLIILPISCKPWETFLWTSHVTVWKHGQIQEQKSRLGDKNLN